MAITRFRAIEHVKQTNASQASRDDAKPAVAKFASYSEEWTDLVQRKFEIQRQLAALNRRASKDNMAIRAKHNGQASGIKEWLQTKGKIELEQERLRERLAEIEDRMAG